MPKRKVFLYYRELLNPATKEPTVGGIQTFIISLCEVIKDYGWAPVVVQMSSDEFDFEKDGVRYIGLNSGKKNIARSLFKRTKQLIDESVDIIVWATFYDSIPLSGYKTIIIQHGISFDFISGKELRHTLLMKFGLGKLLKFRQRSRALKYISNGMYKVCVDYNFVNWYRTYSLRKNEDSIYVIPNFTEFCESSVGKTEKFKNVLFARRFVEKRGIYLAIKAASVLLDKYSDITFTFAGDGAKKNDLLKLQDKYKSRVIVTKYDSKDSVEFHKKFDIAIVPTLGSEGTSYSLLEAMSAGCAVICTNVGGMTNIILDRFNGLMIRPNSKELIESIEKLYRDSAVGNQLKINASNSIKFGFSKELWRERWMKLFSEIDSKDQ